MPEAISTKSRGRESSPVALPLTGYVEFIGYHPGLEALFLGGWTQSGRLSEEISQIRAVFSDCSFSDHCNTFLYERDDVPDQGTGFVFFIRCGSEPPDEFHALQFECGAEVFSIAPTADLFRLSERNLTSHLHHILPSVKNERQYEDLSTVLLGRGFIDYAFEYGGFTVVEGWVFGVSSAIAVRSGLEAISGANVLVFDRPDVSEIYNSRGARAFGFMLVIGANEVKHPVTFDFGMSESILLVEAPCQPASFAEFESFIQRHRKRIGFLINRSRTSPLWVSYILPLLDGASGLSNEFQGHIEEARGVANLGGLVVGWAIAIAPWSIFIISSEGVAISLSDASRWNRADVVEAYGKNFGAFTLNAGFLLGIHGPISLGATVHMVAVNAHQAFRIASAQWAAAPVEPLSFARWAFDFPVHNGDLARRYEIHDSPILSELMRRRNLAFQAAPCNVYEYGVQIDKPICALVIPLYGRFDFMQYQMLEFVEDGFIARFCQIIYVVDDPTIANDVREFSSMLSGLIGVPFSVITSDINRGFAGATNLGVRFSRAPKVLFLNSDVIPQRPGWLSQMVGAYERDPAMGILGARLLFANGCIQHDGMVFKWDASWNAYLNKHPGAGLKPSPPSATPVARQAVTAACALLSRTIFDEVGGLDEGYIIGDFEDSDICLKVRATGRKIACFQDVDLVHLERQSISGMGTDKFRERLARYNACRHQGLWGAEIRRINNRDV